MWRHDPEGAVMGVIARLDRYQRRHRWVGLPLAVLYKYVDDQGGYLAALITYYGFLSVFPLLLLLSSVLGFVLQEHPHLQQQILESALAQFPVIGQELGSPQGLRGSTTAVVRLTAANLDRQLQTQRKMQREPLRLDFLPFAALALPYPCRAILSLATTPRVRSPLPARGPLD